MSWKISDAPFISTCKRLPLLGRAPYWGEVRRMVYQAMGIALVLASVLAGAVWLHRKSVHQNRQPTTAGCGVRAAALRLKDVEAHYQPA